MCGHKLSSKHANLAVEWSILKYWDGVSATTKFLRHHFCLDRKLSSEAWLFDYANEETDLLEILFS